MAEQLKLLFEVPPAAPGQPATGPVPRPKTGESGRFGPISADRREKTAHDGAVTAPQEQGGIGIPPESAGHAGPAAIPALCPVVGRSVCYFDDCRHYQRGGCVPSGGHETAAAAPAVIGFLLILGGCVALLLVGGAKVITYMTNQGGFSDAR